MARIAFYLPELTGGGIQKMAVNLAGVLAKRGYPVDLVLCRARGHLLEQVPGNVRIVALKAAPWGVGRGHALAADPKGFGALLRPVLLPVAASRTLPYLPDLVRYLRRERPAGLVSARPPLNLEALWARDLAGVPTRVTVTERVMPSHTAGNSRKWRWRFLPRLMHRTYPRADAIVAVSDGVADDLSSLTGIPRDRIETIYNPAVTPEIYDKAEEPLDHPWFAPGAPPVVLGVGRLHAQKDFPTLLRAFARVRAGRQARLIILGEAKTAQYRAGLEALAGSLGIAEDVDLPGFVDNPFAYMAKASVFALSSGWEGFGNVLPEALACGCPVVSTDCPSGPAEILDHGKYGLLVPVGDDAKLAAAIDSTLNAAPDRARLRAHGAGFSVDRAADKYLEAMFGRHEGHGCSTSLIPGHELVMAKRDPRPASGWR